MKFMQGCMNVNGRYLKSYLRQVLVANTRPTDILAPHKLTVNALLPVPARRTRDAMHSRRCVPPR
jgi:hypothetical protein